ncbi:MAG: MFS transporter [Chloroflexi bacterium]|nr:MFS transporter [Chloroflexota bacterium]
MSLVTKTAGPLAALRVPSFPWLCGSSFTSALVSMAHSMGQGWLLLDLTDSPFWVGLAPGVMGVTAVAFSPLGGLIVDRLDRRAILMTSHAVNAASLFFLASMVFSGLVQLWHVLLVAAIQGMARASHSPARASLTFDLVGRETMLNAMATQFTAVYLAVLIGPLAGGLVLSAWGNGMLFVSIGAIALLSSVLLLPLKSPPRTIPAVTSNWRNLWEGFFFAFHYPPIRSVMLVILFTEFFGSATMFMLPVVVRDVLGAGPRIHGFLSALWGLGAIVATLSLAVLGDVRGKGWLFLSAALTFGIAMLVFAFSRNLALSLALVFVAGGAGATYDTAGNTLVQSLAPDALRGRVAGVYSFLASSLHLGSMAMGLVAEFRGITFAIALGGGIVVAHATRFLPLASLLGERAAASGKGGPAQGR